MNNLKIQEAITASGLDKPAIATHLFPSNQYPVMALDRVMKGDGDLSSTQITKLSELSGMPVAAIFGHGKWSKEGFDGGIRLLNGSYTAVLDTKTWVTKLYLKSSLIHEEVIHTGTVALSHYLAKLEEIINSKKVNKP